MMIKYNNTLDDVIAFNLYYLETSPAQRKLHASIRWTFLIVLLFFSVIVAWASRSSSYLVYGLMAIVIFIIYPIIARKCQAMQARKMYAEGGGKGVLGLHILEIDENGLTEKTVYNETKTRWDAVDRIAFTDTHTFIYITAISAITLPRHAIVEGDYDAFIAELNRLNNSTS